MFLLNLIQHIKITIILYTIKEYCIIDHKVCIIFNLFHKIMVYVTINIPTW